MTSAWRSSRISMPRRPRSAASSHGVCHVHARHINAHHIQARHMGPLALRRSLVFAAGDRSNARRSLSSRAALYARAGTKVVRETRGPARDDRQPAPLTFGPNAGPHPTAMSRSIAFKCKPLPIGPSLFDCIARSRHWYQVLRMKKQVIRRAVIREWMALPRDKRQTAEQAADFAEKAVRGDALPRSRRDPHRVMLRWLLPRTGRP